MPLFVLPNFISNVRMCINNAADLNSYERFQFFSEIAFTLINVILVCFISLTVIIMRQTDTFPLRIRNMTDYCDDSQYNRKLKSPPANSFLYFMIIVVLLVVFVTAITKFTILSRSKGKAWLKTINKIIRVGIHFFLFCVFLELIKVIAGVPSPYYFSYKELEEFYCSNTPHLNQPTEEIKALDKSMRTSFPSYRAAIFSYCITFLYLYIDHYDIANGLHTTQQVILLLFGGISMHLLINHVEVGENHKSDVIAGVLIGICYAIATIRNIFGSAFYQRIHRWNREEEKVKKIFETENNQTNSITAQSDANPSDNLNEVTFTPSAPPEYLDYNYTRVASNAMTTSR